MKILPRKPEKTLSLDELIRTRAYELYEQRGNREGSDLDDWLQAEKEVLEGETQEKRAA